MPNEHFYPEIEPFTSGTLRVSELHELYWEQCGAADGIPILRMMAVAFTPGSTPTIGHPTDLFSFVPRGLRIACVPVRCFVVAPDGRTFLFTQLDASGSDLMLLENFR